MWCEVWFMWRWWTSSKSYLNLKHVLHVACMGILTTGGSPKVPLVVRLQGNNVEGAMELMKNSDIKCILGDDLDDGAKKVIAAVNAGKK